MAGGEDVPKSLHAPLPARRGRGRGPEVDGDLAEELVGAVAVVVPDGDLEHARREVARADGRVHEALVPVRVACIYHGLSAALRLLAVAGREGEKFEFRPSLLLIFVRFCIHNGYCT